jgi:hypothetical protein
LQQWAQRYNGAGNNRDFAESVAVDKGGNVYVTGTIVSGLDPSGDPFPLLLLDWGTIKYNAAGAQQWVAIYDEGGDDFAVSVKIDKNGNPYVTGAISNSPPGAEDADEDYGTIKYDPAGNRLWVAKYGPGPDGVGFFPRDQVLDAEGNVYVTGAGNQLAEASYTTVKFDKNGALQWAVDYRNGLSQDARAVEVDDVGNVYVTGNSNIPDCLRCIDFATIKYSQFACGKNGDKFLVCHKGKTTLCLKKSDVEEHLRHGDQLGECPKPDCDVNARISQQSENEAVTAMADRFKVTVAPNPAAGITKIYYELPVDGQVSIQVFDVLGRQIATLINANQQAGLHNTEMDVSPLMNGIYIYRIMVKTAKKSWSETGKINVIK